MADAWPIHTVVFDLDDTLYPERDFVLSGFAAVDRWLSAKGIVGFADVAGKRFSSGSRGRIFDEALAALDVPASPELIADLVEIYRSHRPALTLLPDAERALRWAQQLGMRTALITDGFQTVQRNKIEALGLASRITCCIVTDELGGRGFWKPHHGAFLRVMECCPGARSGFVYIADNPRKDFIAPRLLGWKTIRIKRSGGEHSSYEPQADEAADIEVNSLAELSQILAPSF